MNKIERTLKESADKILPEGSDYTGQPNVTFSGTTSMNEEKARELIGAINADNSIGPSYGDYIYWAVGASEAVLDSSFTADELEAIAWWMRNKKP